MIIKSRETRPRVLIVSSYEDGPSLDPVVRRLQEQVAVTLIQAETVVSGDVDFEVFWSPSGTTLRLGPELIEATEFQSGWWRKPHWLKVERSDPLVAISIRREVLASLRLLEHLIPADRWLNSPSVMERASNKFLQFELAHEAGFSAPRTGSCNSWALARARFPQPFVYKLIDGTLVTSGGTQVVFTELIEDDAPGSSPFPGLVQEAVIAGVEWRVTVIEGNVLAARIRKNDGTIDWRREQLAGRATFEAGELPKRVEAGCRALVQRLGLRFGAIDLIEASGGEWWFLECNPNGQYGWLEEEAGLPVSAAIASSLENLALGDETR